MPTNTRYSKPEDMVSAYDAVAITKSDSTVINTTRAIYVGGAGNVVVTMESGADCTFTAAVAGSILPIQVTKVKAATTATDLVALY